MRAAAILLMLASLPAGAQVTFSKWQDMGQYVGQQTEKLNQHTDQIAALEAKVAALEASKTTVEKDLGLVIQRYDMLLRAIVVQVCASNKAMADNAWAAKLAGLEPIPLTGHTCPPLPARYYVPGYLSPNGPPIPPAE